MPKTPRPKSPHLGAVRLSYDKKTGSLVYWLRGGNQTAIDASGRSLDTYIHALYALLAQRKAKRVAMIGCGGGVLGRMLKRDGWEVTIVDIDPRSFDLARKHFGLQESVTCRATDGLAFLQKSRRTYDALIVDAFIGEKIPAHLTTDEFCAAARKRLSKDGLLLMNVCLNDRKDLTADDLAARFKRGGWSVRLLDQRGGPRNALVLAGDVKALRAPKLVHPPAIERPRVRRELKGMRFRRPKRTA